MASNNIDESQQQVFVRFLGENRAVNINKGCSILQLKENICRFAGHKPQELKIVFAGHVLPDNLTLKQCDLGKTSIVHAIASITNDSNEEHKSAAKSNFVSNSRSQNADRKKNSRFYVYCKTICSKTQPGKLRVRCSCCKDEAFALSKDPDGWQDVLERNRINGSCNECNCKAAEFFFKCAGHDPFGDERDEAVPLCHVTSNIMDSLCMACLDKQDPVLTFPCGKRHTLCLPCFSLFCQSKIRDRQMVLVEDPKHIGYTLSCPGGSDSCGDAFIEEVHHFRVAGNELYEQYQRFATEDLVLQSGGILCPGRGCGSGIFPASDTARRISCERQTGGCGLIFCRSCLCDYHYGDCRQEKTEPGPTVTDYSNLVENALKVRRETSRSLAKIEETTKSCPGCQSPTEKAGGCNHMTCQRCKFQWCWNCQIEWNSNCQGNHWFRLL